MITPEEGMLDKRKQERERIATDRQAAKNDGNTGSARRMGCATFIRLMVRCIASKKILRNVNLSVRAMVHSTFDHDKFMKEQTQRRNCA